MCLTVAAWLAIQRRPAIKDTEVAAAIAWAEDVEAASCERTVLFGRARSGDGSAHLARLVESNGCGDPSCRTLIDAVQHEAVCAPERSDGNDWLSGVVQHATTLPATERLRLLMHALRALDDLRRGEQRTSSLPLDSSALHDTIRAVFASGEPLDDVDDLSRAADLLVTTSPDFAAYAVSLSAGIIIHALRRGENHRASQHPRAATVAWSNVAQHIDACPDIACIEASFVIPRPEPVSKIMILLQGAPVAHDFQIGGISRFAAGRMRRAMTSIESQRATERLLAAALRILASCTTGNEPSLDDLSVEHSTELRDLVIPERALPTPICPE